MSAIEAAQLLHAWAQHEGLMPGDVAPLAAWDVARAGEIEPMHDAGKTALRSRQVLTVGYSEDDRSVVVFTRRPIPQSRRFRALLPQRVCGYKVVFRQGVQTTIGGAEPAIPFGGPAFVIRTTLSGQHLTCGSSISVGNNRDAGTLGCLVRATNGDLMGLSNNHVTGACNYASAGLPIVAPGIFDVVANGLNPFTLGFHTSSLPMVPGTVDNVNAQENHDAAIFRIENPQLVSSFQGSAYDTPSSAIDPVGGMAVEKIGRTTGHTHGQIVCQVLGAMPISYNAPLYNFAGQVYFDPIFVVVGQGDSFSDHGDSGSLVTTVDASGVRCAVGLIVGGMMDGSAPGGKVSLMLPIRSALTALNLTLVSGHNL